MCTKTNTYIISYKHNGCVKIEFKKYALFSVNFVMEFYFETVYEFYYEY